MPLTRKDLHGLYAKKQLADSMTRGKTWLKSGKASSNSVNKDAARLVC